MKTAWLYCFPLLFLPNLGFGIVTEFGVLELSDLVIFPYLLLLLLAPRPVNWVFRDKVVPLISLFVTWALVSTLLIDVEYEYASHFHTYYGLLKLGKFSIYAAAGVLTARAVSSGRLWARYEHCLLAAGVVIAAGLVTIGQKSLNSARPEHFGYKASNAISVLAAMFACYCLGSWLQQRRSMPVGRKVTLGLVTGGLVLGAAISQGRGGWVGGAAGLLYICYRRRLKWQTLAIAICVPTYVWLLYTHSEAFRHTAYATLFPEEVKAQADFAGMDTGGRLSNWIASVKQFQSPVFGTGFFHRGASSGLWENGSHNFFLQMFLETGIPGGVLMLLIIRRLWRLAGMGEGGRRDLELPIKAALVAAIVGGMSGEYLYGGPVLLALFAMCPVAGAPRAPRRQRLSAARPQWNKTAYPASSF